MKAKTANAELKKLVEFFNGDGEVFGRAGDYDDLTPAETAIRALRAYLHLRKETGDEANVFGQSWEDERRADKVRSR